MQIQNPKLKIFFLIIIFCGVFGMTGKSLAADFYIAQNASGGNTGIDCANTYAVSWLNNGTNWANPKQAGKIGPGDTVHLCGAISNSIIVQNSGAPNSPIVIFFEPGSIMSSPIWDQVMWGRSSAILISQKDFIVIDGGVNGIIESTANGTNLVNQIGQYGVWLYGGDDCEIKNLEIRNLYVREPLSGDSTHAGTGIYASGNRNIIHNNRIYEGENGISYSYPGSILTENVKIYGNTISRVSNGIAFGSGNVGALADNVEIYSNDISEEYVWDGVWTGCTGDCWFHNDGIQVWAVHTDSQITNLKIYNNYIHGDLGRHITGWIFVEGNAIEHEIFNNILVSTGTSYPANGMITSSGNIFNNTIFTSLPGICINAGSNSQIKNNIMHNCGTGIGIHSPDINTQIDYNLYNFAGEINMATVGAGGTFLFASSFEAWQSNGFDIHSQIANSQFVDVNDFNFYLIATSPAIDAGTNISSTNFTTDKNGISRPQGFAWDIGAYEFIGTDMTPPNAPSGLNVN